MGFLSFDGVRNLSYVGDVLDRLGLQNWGDVVKWCCTVLLGLLLLVHFARRFLPSRKVSLVASRVLAALEGESVWVRRAPKTAAADGKGIPAVPCAGLDGELLAANVVIVYLGDQMTEVKAGVHNCLKHLSRREQKQVQKAARKVILRHEENERKAEEQLAAHAVSGGVFQVTLPRQAAAVEPPAQPPVNSEQPRVARK